MTTRRRRPRLSAPGLCSGFRSAGGHGTRHGPRPCGCSAPISEIFYGFQGEGLWVGVPQVFIRLSGCQIGCAYCDTPQHEGRNYSVAALWQRVHALYRSHAVHSLSLTGGEPLLYPEFLVEFLRLRPGKKPYVYLETNGILYHALRQVRPWVDMVAMDIKLPSATRAGDFWREHACFLRACRGTAVFVKMVITRATARRDVEQAAALVGSFNRHITLVLQPNSAEWGAPLRAKIYRLAALACRQANDVRVIPQVHVLLGVR